MCNVHFAPVSQETTTVLWFLWATFEASLTLPSAAPGREPTRKCTLYTQMYCTRHKWILSWVAACESVCKMHVTGYFFNKSRAHKLFGFGVAIFKISGI
jgi:hypothetical protein